MLHTHADGNIGVNSDSDSLKATTSASSELFASVELVWLLLPRSLFMSSSTLRPTLCGLHPTKINTQTENRKLSKAEMCVRQKSDVYMLACVV